MQDQMANAMTRAAAQFTQGVSPAQPPRDQRPGSRMLAAMVAARESACQCRSCRLLRQELEEAIGSFLRAVSEDAQGYGA